MHLEDDKKRSAERSEEKKKLDELASKYAEAQADRDRMITRLDTSENERRKREQQKACLAELAADGDELKATRVHNKEDLNDWLERYRESIGTSNRK